MRARGLLLATALGLTACSGGNDQVAIVTEPAAPTTRTPEATTTTEAAEVNSITSTTTVATTTTTRSLPTPTTSMLLPPSLAPDGDAAYTPPDPLPRGNPGEVIWRRPLGEVEGATSELIMYHSTGRTGIPTVATAALVVPAGPAPPGGHPIVSWAHGTTGLADVCAPSKAFGPHHIVGLQAFLDAGYAVVATDYQGLGPPGLHPYLVGDSEGRSVLDAARAADRLLGTASSGTVVIGGHSQGGQAAIWAGQLAPTYTPELDVVGVVAIAPAVQMSATAGSLTSIRPLAGYGVAALAGMAAYYSELDLDEVLSAEALADLDVLEERCMGDVLAHFSTVPYRILAADPFTVGAWAERIQDNIPGDEALTMPLLVTQGSDDALIIESVTAAYVTRACAAGSIVDYRVVDDADHASILGATEGDMMIWLSDRLAGAPAASTCG